MADKNLFDYTEDSIKSLGLERAYPASPGMYIGKLGDGSSPLRWDWRAACYATDKSYRRQQWDLKACGCRNKKYNSWQFMIMEGAFPWQGSRCGK